MSIQLGAKFGSYAEFDQAFKKFQVANNSLFVTKASKTAGVVNARLSADLKIKLGGNSSTQMWFMCASTCGHPEVYRQGDSSTSEVKHPT